MLAKQAGMTYDNYGTIASQLLGNREDPAEAERRQRDRMEQQMEKIAQAVRHLTHGYGGEGVDE